MHASKFFLHIVIMCLLTLLYMYAVGYLRHWEDFKIFTGKSWAEIEKARKAVQKKLHLNGGKSTGTTETSLSLNDINTALRDAGKGISSTFGKMGVNPSSFIGKVGTGIDNFFIKIGLIKFPKIDGKIGADISMPTISSGSSIAKALEKIANLMPYQDPCIRYGENHRFISNACIDKMWYDSGCTAKPPEEVYSQKFKPKSGMRQLIGDIANDLSPSGRKKCYGANYEEILQPCYYVDENGNTDSNCYSYIWDSMGCTKTPVYGREIYKTPLAANMWNIFTKLIRNDKSCTDKQVGFVDVRTKRSIGLAGFPTKKMFSRLPTTLLKTIYFSENKAKDKPYTNLITFKEPSGNWNAIGKASVFSYPVENTLPWCVEKSDDPFTRHRLRNTGDCGMPGWDAVGVFYAPTDPEAYNGIGLEPIPISYGTATNPDRIRIIQGSTNAGGEGWTQGNVFYTADFNKMKSS